MSQAFSLYEELTVRQNLELHAKLYQIADGKTAISQALRDFDLSDVEHTKPASLPLGIRQRLQLAAACLHSPEVLILDEPTSGVDPRRPRHVLAHPAQTVAPRPHHHFRYPPTL